MQRRVFGLWFVVAQSFALVAGTHAQVQVGAAQALDVRLALDGPRSVASRDFAFPDAGFVRLHLTDFALAPGDRISVRDAQGNLRHEFTQVPLHETDMVGRPLSRPQHDAWTTVIYAQPITVTLRAGPAPGARGVRVDRAALGAPKYAGAAPCTTDCVTPNVECATGIEYQRRTPVGRLHFTEDGVPYTCTAWLIGAPDCLITNYHCLEDADAGSVTVEFNFECDACFAGNAKLTTTFMVPLPVAANANLDYVLVQCAGAPATAFGVLPVGTTTPDYQQPVYLIGHSNGELKGISYGYALGPLGLDGQSACNAPPVTAEVSYTTIASPGSSGSPVLCRSSQRVVALHHCGYGPGCDLGAGVPMSAIAPEIQPVMDSLGCIYDFAAGVCLDPIPPIQFSPDFLGLPGSNGVPFLYAQGTLVLGSFFSTAVKNGKPGAPGYLVLGIDSISANFKGGILIPAPEVLVSFTPDVNGRWSVVLPWPAGFPPNFFFFAQAWIVDAAGPKGYAASEALGFVLP